MQLESQPSIDYHAYLIASLQDPKEAEAYLAAAYASEDPEIIAIAEENIKEAQSK